MFGIGKKDKDGKQVRIEHRGKHLRASRTGGVALRTEKKIGPVNLTANTAKGLRASTRVSNGMRIALQNGRTQLIGRWQNGPLNVNLSKTGLSASVKNKAGTFNFLKPQYSSVKFAGVQLRGKNAAYIQIVYLLIAATALAIIFLAKLLIFILWLLSLSALFTWDLIAGFTKEIRNKDTHNSRSDTPDRDQRS